MRLSTFFKFMVFVTMLSLIYINLQMQIYDLAYQGKQKEGQIIKISEENGNVTYNILRIKSSNNLGTYLLDERSDMRFLDDSKIVELETGAVAEEVLASGPIKKTNNILSFLNLPLQAEAKPQE